LFRTDAPDLRRGVARKKEKKRETFFVFLLRWIVARGTIRGVRWGVAPGRS
jgi:hypothetical protein